MSSIDTNIIHRIIQIGGQSIQVRVRKDNGHISATDICLAAGKEPIAFIKRRKFQELLSATRLLLRVENNSDVYSTNRGGTDPGTWFHPHLIPSLVKWINPDWEVELNALVTQCVAAAPSSSALVASAPMEVDEQDRKELVAIQRQSMLQDIALKQMELEEKKAAFAAATRERELAARERERAEKKSQLEFQLFVLEQHKRFALHESNDHRDRQEYEDHFRNVMAAMAHIGRALTDNGNRLSITDGCSPVSTDLVVPGNSDTSSSSSSSSSSSATRINETVWIQVSDYLRKKQGRVPSKEDAQDFGYFAKAVYKKERGTDPQKHQQKIDGAFRMVNTYSDRDLPILDRAYPKFLAWKTARALDENARKADYC